ncbi:hypothetical protein BSL78_24163 [Apostichopus japonicus]|uniref:Reverse transcriptase domain-containing protein n=1 Tax=Stichopus japonicus TaxID=307972 RepID=A0A2G8JT89_STIJA|nr:hypothetical protein BSL78_24163 [Apostichopus japonicus]
MNLTDEDIWLEPRTPLGIIQSPSFVEDGLVTGEKAEIQVNQITTETPSFHETAIPFTLSPSLTPTQRQQAVDLINRNQDIFAYSDDQLGFAEGVTHKINTIDDIPVKQPHRRIPPSQWEEVKEHIRKLLDNGVIRPSTSPYASPIVLVRKSDGSLRLCVDYRKLNMKTIKDAYPIPRIDESIDALHGTKWFSTIDLLSGYHQVAMEEADKHKTSFTTPFGLYEYNRMPFGLSNAPGTFQRLMQACLHDQFFTSVLCYLDDILVFSKSFDDHLVNLQRVFDRLRQQGLKIKPSKCTFFQSEVKYLGHRVTADGVRPDPDKVQAVKNWPEPQNVKDLRSFLGFCSFYRRFVVDFAKTAKPLHALVSTSLQNQRAKKEHRFSGQTSIKLHSKN